MAVYPTGFATTPQYMPQYAMASYAPVAPYIPAPQPLPLPSGTAPEIAQALVLLGQIQHVPGDEQHMNGMGVEVIFKNGQDALNLILSKQIRVEFGDMGADKAHAQWIKDQNLIMINQKYKGDLSKDTLYAISEAIYHEAGHAARNGDDQTSLQEEINCLALNVLGNRFHNYIDPQYAQSASNSRLIMDGVALYTRLFFDPDPGKRGLVNRVIEKYGQLPAESPDHRIPIMQYGVPMTDRVLRQHKLNVTA